MDVYTVHSPMHTFVFHLLYTNKQENMNKNRLARKNDETMLILSLAHYSIAYTLYIFGFL